MDNASAAYIPILGNGRENNHFDFEQVDTRRDNAISGVHIYPLWIPKTLKFSIKRYSNISWIDWQMNRVIVLAHYAN